MVQWHILYSGRVQGVGFRYTFARKAKALELAGWVKNLPDGRVEAVVEGSATDLKILMSDVAEHFDGHIHHIDKTERKPTGRFTGFNIAF